MIEEIKLFLGIKDKLQDDLLTLINKDSKERILAKMNEFAAKNETDRVKDTPEELQFIQRDVSIKRFNRINSEGATSDVEIIFISFLMIVFGY